MSFRPIPGLSLGLLPLIGAAWLTVGSASAQQPPAPEAPKAEAEAAAAPSSNAMTTPSMAGPLVANPSPFSFEAGPLGTIYATGVLSGLAFTQSNPTPGDTGPHIDVSNAHLILQKTEGVFQFYSQVGLYSFPALGTPYANAGRTTGNTFSPIPVVYGKFAPSDTVSMQVGKLPTLIGAEYAFTFQNMNIERGLLWNQEPIVSRGIQANYTLGPLALSGSLNDGFYSDSYNWLSGSAAYTIDKQNTVTVAGGGNFDHTDKNAVTSTLPLVVKTPFPQNNGSIFNLIYTYNAAPWTITPYFQYTHVPGSIFGRSNDTIGGAVLANYAFNDNLNLAGRVEYISSSANSLAATNLLYGPRSDAWSVTLTPTYQEGIFFARIEGSYVQASSTTPGFVFGKTGNAKDQARFLFESGIVF